MDLRKNISSHALYLLQLIAFPIFSSHTDYSSRIYETECPRSTALHELRLFPLAIVKLIRQYEPLVPAYKIQHSIPIDASEANGPATAFGLLRDRIIMAHKRGLLSIVNYVTGKPIKKWQSLQKNIDEITTVTCSVYPSEDRIYTRTDQLAGHSFRSWDGEGEILFVSMNLYTLNYTQPGPLVFDALTSHFLSGVNIPMLSRIGSPFSIERRECKHALYVTPSRIITAYKSGLIEYWRYKYKTPLALWERMPLKVNEKDLQPVTALCRRSDYCFLAGFLNGTIEAWRYAEDTELWKIEKTWKAHKESVKNIKIFNSDVCITSAGNVLKLWQLPYYEKIGKTQFHTPIVSVLTTNNPYPPNYAIVCFGEEPLQVLSC